MQRLSLLCGFGLLVCCLGLRGLAGEQSAKTAPAIDGYGAVTRYPEAADQPRDGAKIVVDITVGGARDAINPAIEKLARFVNIYAAAGKKPARAQITAVLHGDATQVALNHDAYATACGSPANPNLALIRKLRAADVEFVVCGQALTNKGYEKRQVAGDVTLAVSGLTALVNRQRAGYAYVPLLK